MVELSTFLEKVCAAGKPVDPPMLAYRMDNTSSDMRTSVGLGTCNSCDYFTFANKRVVLIEETRLIAKIKDVQKEQGLDSEDNGQLAPKVRDVLRDEKRLKVYGSLLVLCRLARRLADDAEAAMVSGVADFFLVISDEVNPDFARALDQIETWLTKDLRDVLTRAAINDVRIVWAKHIGDRLPARPVLP